MAIENKGGPAAQARARTQFPNTGGTIIGGVGTGAVQAGPQLIVETRVVPRSTSSRVLPLDLIAARLEAAFGDRLAARLKPEQVTRMREGTAKAVLAFKTANAPDESRAVPAAPPPAARAALPPKKK
jgi:hypothetical protein